MSHRRFLLIQIRDYDDHIRHREIEDFARATGVPAKSIMTHDLLAVPLTPDVLNDVECAFIGGSGKYSAVGEGDWVEPALRSLRCLHDFGTPTFASCWGHQAIARAMGGRVARVEEFAEVGTIPLTLTEAGRADPIFGQLPSPFPGQVGHEDTVVQLPAGTTLLASSDRCRVHAYRFDDAPMYCTQFHPELTRAALVQRIEAYPEYIERIEGIPLDEFKLLTRESPGANELLARFVAKFVGS